MRAVGIDFGTSAVRAATSVEAEPKAIVTPDGAEEILAAVSFAAGGPHIGLAARNQAVMQPQATVCDVKTWLTMQDPAALPVHLRAAGGVVLELASMTFAQLPEGPLSPAQVAGLLLRRIAELATQELGQAPEAVLFSHPLTPSASFDAGVLAAAHAAGFPTADFVAEPVAAAVKLCSRDHGRPVFIADVGAMHTSIAVVEVGPDRIPLLLHAVSEPVGGDAVTLEILRQATGGRDLAQLHAGMLELLRQYCEQMKKDLATAETTSCMLPPMFVAALGVSEQLTLDRNALRHASEGLLHVVEDCATRALGGAGSAGRDLELYVIGGSARLPFVCPLIERVLGTRARVARAANVIALGAAKLAASKSSPRALDDVRTRASWRPPARIKLATPTPIAFGVRTPAPSDSQPHPQPQRSDSQPLPSSDALRIPAAPRVPRITPLPERAASPSAAAPSVAAPSARPSQSATGARHSVHSISVTQITAGHVRNPTTPTELLQIPGARALHDADLEPISLPLLLLLTGSKRRSGILELQMDGSAALSVPFLEGRAMLLPSENAALIERFKQPMGSYHFEDCMPEVGSRKPETALSVVSSGLRALMRGFDDASLKRGLGERLSLAPEVSAAQQLRLGNLGLGVIETRVVKFSLNGRNTSQGVLDHSGVSAQTVLSLLYLLDVFGLVEWKEAERKAERSLSDELEARARSLEAANFFQVLGVHWSASGAEIDAAYRKLVTELGEGQPVFAMAPSACRRMLARIETARETLADHKRRDAYRRATYPDINFDGVEDLLEKKHRALQLQDRNRDKLREVERSIHELGRTKSKHSKPPPK